MHYYACVHSTWCCISNFAGQSETAVERASESIMADDEAVREKGDHQGDDQENPDPGRLVRLDELQSTVDALVRVANTLAATAVPRRGK